MLRAFTERRDSGQPSTTNDKSKTSGASSSKQNITANPKVSHKRKTSGKLKVAFKSQVSGTSGSQAQKSRTRTTTKKTCTNTTPVSRRHKALASLLVSFLATSSVAIDIEAADQKTIESANKASTTPLPSKPHPRSTGGVKPSEIRRTRWKRFRYEMGLKMKSGRNGKQRRSSIGMDEMEMVDLLAREREEGRN
jgi:hypothetical protein